MRARECEWCDRPEVELRLRILGNTRCRLTAWGQCAPTFAWLVDKEIERQAKAAAHEEFRMSAENSLQQLRSAEVSE